MCMHISLCKMSPSACLCGCGYSRVQMHALEIAWLGYRCTCGKCLMRSIIWFAPTRQPLAGTEQTSVRNKQGRKTLQQCSESAARKQTRTPDTCCLARPWWFSHGFESCGLFACVLVEKEERQKQSALKKHMALGHVDLQMYTSGMVYQTRNN
jgi:hypothetical protein